MFDLKRYLDIRELGMRDHVTKEHVDGIYYILLAPANLDVH